MLSVESSNDRLPSIVASSLRKNLDSMQHRACIQVGRLHSTMQLRARISSQWRRAALCLDNESQVSASLQSNIGMPRIKTNRAANAEVRRLTDFDTKFRPLPCKLLYELSRLSGQDRRCYESENFVVLCELSTVFFGQTKVLLLSGRKDPIFNGGRLSTCQTCSTDDLLSYSRLQYVRQVITEHPSRETEL